MRNFITMFFYFSFLLLTVGNISCGGDEDVTSPSEVFIDTLKGTYKLIAFTVTFDNGTTVTQDDVSSYSGTLVISSDGNMSQTITIEGTTGTVTGTFEIIDNTTLQVTSSNCTYNLKIDLSGNILTTTLASGACGINFSEIDVWEKTSQQATHSQEKSLDLHEKNNLNTTTIGGIVGRI